MPQNDSVYTLPAENLRALGAIFHADKNKDIIFREFTGGTGKRYGLAYLEGMAAADTINDFILRPLFGNRDPNRGPLDIAQLSSCSTADSHSAAASKILAGDTVLFEEGSCCCFVFETKGFERRSVGQPTAETIIKGSQEAFTETLRTNITLLRRIIKCADLCSEFIPVGKLNQSNCAVVYLDNIINRDTLDEVKRRLNGIKGDYIMGSGMVEQLIEDNPLSLFPTILSTERPERAAYYLMSGRIAIVCDGSPFVIVVPVSLALLLDSPEGSSQRFQVGTFSRLIRIFALLCTTMVSGLYLAMILYHREMIPTQLLSAIVEARTNIPFPSLFEVLTMELFFELVREAGLRVPNALGGAIGIVGGLILGQAAVEANLVSPVTLIVVALSGVGNVVLPDYDLAYSIRTVKLLFILFGASLGFLRIAMARLLTLTMLSAQSSFGVPMLSVQTLKWGSGHPTIAQRPLWKLGERPRELKTRRPVEYPPRSREWVKDGKDGQ